MEIMKYLQCRVVFLGVGNPVKGDDGVGCILVEELKKAGNIDPSRPYLFNGGQAPENYLEPIVRLAPDRVFIVDAVDFGGAAGDIRLFEEAPPQSDFSTHALSLSLMVKYLSEKTHAKTLILGIQPGQLQWGTGLSSEVQAAVKKLVNHIGSFV